MQIMKNIIATVALIFVFNAADAHSKRLGPDTVEPIAGNNVVYSAPAFVPGENQNGGYVEAREKEGGKLIWRLRVYRTEYNPQLERDVQDIFMVSIRLENEAIVVVDEKGRVFKVNLNTRDIIRGK